MRLRNLPVFPEDLTELLKLPRNWMQESENWYQNQAEISQVIVCSEDSYPSAFLHMEDPPLFLFTRGNWEPNHNRRLAVVGSRKAFPESLRWMDSELGAFFQKVKPLILSGGARGIDQKAHFLALRHSCPTYVFLPSSLDRPYPKTWKEQEKFFTESNSCFVTEYPRGTEMRPHHFVKRNRLLASLASHCLIIQAGPRSGTLLTAQMALRNGRELGALSHFSGCKEARGGLDLLAAGAPFIRDCQDLQVWTNWY